jgi:hypothetical protein
MGFLPEDQRLSGQLNGLDIQQFATRRSDRASAKVVSDLIDFRVVLRGGSAMRTTDIYG